LLKFHLRHHLYLYNLVYYLSQYHH
jgi:hypothetical protein